MKPSHLATFLKAAIPQRKPILITGKPGIGKTSILEQVTQALGFNLIKSIPGVEDPTEPGGYPWIAPDRSHAEKVLFGQAHRACHAKDPTVWFLDDLGQAPAATQAAYMQWILAREMNGHVLPEHVSIVAATNHRTDRAGVSGILEPVKSRFLSIVRLEADPDDWVNDWAFNRPDYIDAEDIAFIRFRPDLLCDFNPTADMTNSPLPRTWDNACQVLRLGLPPDVEAEALAGAVGEGASAERLAFRSMCKELVTIEEILKNPKKAPIPGKPDQLYAVSTALASKASKETLEKIGIYINRMLEAGHGEFATLLIRDATRRAPEIVKTPAFVKLATGELGELIGAV